MNTQTKKHLYAIWKKIRWIEPAYILVLLAFFVAVSAIALRSNYQTMTELRQAVYQADKEEGDVEGALRKLREHVYAHMNTNLSSGNTEVYPPLQLKYTYERLVAAELAKAQAASGDIYSQAQTHCEKLHPESYSGGPRVPCIREYVANHGGQPAKTIPDSLYKFNFISPRWSPDIAGWGVLATIATGLLLFMRLTAPFIRKKLRI